MPRPIALVLALLLAACGGSDGRPSIAKEVALSTESGSPAWTARLNERFPPGTTDQAIEAELKRQGFEIQPGEHTANFGWTRFPCANTLTAHWTLDADRKVVSIVGDYSNACP